MIDALHDYIEASFAAFSKAQLASTYSKLAATFGYSTTLIVDAAKLDTAFASSVVISTLNKPTLTEFDAQVPFATNPIARLAGEIDVPFDARDLCARFGLSERQLRPMIPSLLQNAVVVVFPVHRSGRLALFIVCSGTAPDRTLEGRALLHASAHVLYDRYTAVNELQALSQRQADCLFLAAQGKTYAEIGKALGLAPRTVRADLAKAKQILNARTKSEAIAKAMGREGG
jgi:LuxR family transcriptional regulator, transcriptional regulator of spore coat protein